MRVNGDGGEPILELRNLEIGLEGTRDRIVDGVSLTINRGEFFGLLGESGAGKSMTAWGAVNLLPKPAYISAGDVIFRGTSLLNADYSLVREIRGKRVAIAVQNPGAAFHPMRPVGRQIAAVFAAHNDVSRKVAKQRSIEMLSTLGIPDPEVRYAWLPYQFSGGMAQRIMLAMALVNNPELLIADEPTTGLDVTVQAEILDLMIELVRSSDTTVWIIVHDLGVAANYTTRIAVMLAGQIVETAQTSELFENPLHPYTQSLLSDTERGNMDDDAARSAESLTAHHIGDGCRYASRCPLVEEYCRIANPDLEAVKDDHDVRCFVVQRSVDT